MSFRLQIQVSGRRWETISMYATQDEAERALIDMARIVTQQLRIVPGA